MLRRFVLLVVLSATVASRASAIVLCAKPNGEIAVRTACKKKEVRVTADQIGAQGPPGQQGVQGPPGPGTDLACPNGTTGTNLMFPYVTNIQGFDTGIAISNTSSDPFGTQPESGNCVLHFFQGASNPSNVATGTIAAGTTYTNLASTMAPGFNGYVFAVCDFRYAHGFAFVSDVGARNLAMGYLPLVTCPGRSPAHPEQLLH